MALTTVRRVMTDTAGFEKQGSFRHKGGSGSSAGRILRRRKRRRGITFICPLGRDVGRAPTNVFCKFTEIYRGRVVTMFCHMSLVHRIICHSGGPCQQTLSPNRKIRAAEWPFQWSLLAHPFFTSRAKCGRRNPILLPPHVTAEQSHFIQCRKCESVKHVKIALTFYGP